MTDAREEPTVIATADKSRRYRVPVGSCGLSEGESRNIIFREKSSDGDYEAVLAESACESEDFFLFVYKFGTFAYGHALTVTSRTEMMPNYPVEDIPLSNREWHLAVTTSGLVAVVTRYASTVASELGLSSLPEAPQSESETALVVGFDSRGLPMLTEPFVSGIADFDLSPNGKYLAVLTTFPDVATYLYTTDGQYLGSALGRGTEQYCSFLYPKKKKSPAIELSGPNMSSETIPVDDEAFGAATSGNSRLIQADEHGPIHIIVPESLPDSTDNLRLRGTEVESVCGEVIKPISSYLVFNSQREADDTTTSLCPDCSEAADPAEKFEERVHEM